MIALRGHFRAVCVILPVQREIALKLLSPNCALDDQTLTPAGTHPIVLLMGDETDVGVPALPFSIAYSESLVAVPWVRRRDKPCGFFPLAHVGHLWLNRFLPTAGGWFFGLPKTWKRIRTAGRRFQISTLRSGRPLLEATFFAEGRKGPASTFSNFKAIRPIFEQPFIQQFLLIGPTCAEIMNFHIDDAQLQTLGAYVDVFKGLSDGIAPGSYEFNSLDSDPLGAFRIECSWTLTAPMPCHSLRPRKIKIAVLGGGCGSMAAVWALTRPSDWKDRFDITVYQVGWRLGGKCASGRDEDNAFRIYEHGLHLWGGFYQNSFRWMNEVYGKLDPDPKNPIAPPADPTLPRWWNAFKKMNSIIIQEKIDGQYIPWNIDFPPKPDIPGTGGVIPNPWLYIVAFIDEMRRRMTPHLDVELKAEPFTAAVQVALQRLDYDGGGSIFPHIFLQHYEAAPGTPYRPSLEGYEPRDLLDGARALANSFPDDVAKHSAVRHDDLIYIVESAASNFLKRANLQDSNAKRRAELLLDFALATFRGVIRDGLLWLGWEAADHLEWREWLGSHGACEATRESALVRGMYDYVFGFLQGDPQKRSFAAGTATHAVFRVFFTWKGAAFWEMLAGMGDVVFAPLYSVLQKQGVKFEFFSRVKKLVVRDNDVVEIEMERQASLPPGKSYDPLITVGGVPAWPSRPRYDQLIEGDELRKRPEVDLESHWTSWKGESRTLYRGEDKDFDVVLLGISIGALREIADEVATANPAFDTMLENIKTVQTHSMQLWLDEDAQALGAPQGKCIVAATEPIATWCDMTHLLVREAWPPNNPRPPKYLVYSCGELPDCNPNTPNFPQSMLQQFHNMAAAWLSSYTGTIWNQPGTSLDWSVLHDPTNAVCGKRLDAQYLRVNVNPSDRYVAVFPKTSQWRLPPDYPVLRNLFITGDWTKTPINAGCVEAAVMAGLLAAKGISGNDIDIIGARE